MSKVLVITTSLRAKSNSDRLAEELIRGAKDAGHEVEQISLKGKEIRFCIGCLSCQKTQKCVLKDDAVRIAEKVKEAETLVFVTPIYYYEMSGQMKTLLDRMNPLYPSDYKFRKVYMLSVAAEDEDYVPEKAVSGLQGWVSSRCWLLLFFWYAYLRAEEWRRPNKPPGRNEPQRLLQKRLCPI